MVTLIHLRDLAGMSKPATKRYPEASHEVVVMSLNPDHPLAEPGQIQHPLYYLQGRRPRRLRFIADIG